VEGGTFHTPRIAELLRKGYVESRLHMDAPESIPAEHYRVQRRLQAELVGVTTVPYYAILDPDDGEFLVRWHLRGPDPKQWEQDFLRILAIPQPKRH